MEKVAEEALALRQRAEKALVHLTGLAKIDAEAGPTLVRELRLHQIELEMQNHALREAQFELERSRQQYRQLCDSAPFPYLRLSSDTTVTYANEAAQKLLGARVLGTRFSTLINPADALHFAMHRRDASASEDGEVLGLRLMLDGHSREVRLHSSRVARGEDELLVAIVDVDAQHHFERGLQEYAFASAVLSAAGLLVVLDASGKIVRVNERCAQALGGARSLLLRPFVDVFAARAQGEMVRNKLSVTREQGRSQTFECAMGDEARQPLWISWTTTLLTGGATAGHVLVTGTDVTERRRLQQQLLLTDRLAAVGTLAAGMAHEINNPLGYVMGSVAVAKRMLAAKGACAEDAVIRERLDAIQEGSERIRDIVDNLRAFCRDEPVVFESVDIRSVLETSLKLAQTDIRHCARLVKSCEDVPRVSASAPRLAQVFLNLLANAAHAIPPGHADHHCIAVRVYETEGWVCAEVEDSGQGIAPKDLPHVFDPFFTTKLAGAGMGLGLSVCHSIVTECGGHIEVESTLGQGSLFRLFLPIAGQVMEGDGPTRPSGTYPIEPVIPDSSQQRLRVLVVDDEPQLARTLACMLSDEQVQVVHSGEQALRLCQHADFDLILCDLLMPQMTGLDFYAALRGVSPDLQDRVVFMTGCLNDLENLPAPMAEVLHKPFSIDDLTRVVEAYRQRRHYAGDITAGTAAE